MESTTLVYYRHTNFAPDYDYTAAYADPAYAEQPAPAATSRGVEQENYQQNTAPQTSNFKAKYWTFVFFICALPLLNSAAVNAYSLSKNIFRNVSLSKQRNQLINEKNTFQQKLDELSTDSGLSRAIKQEMNLLHKNEILIKLSTVN